MVTSAIFFAATVLAPVCSAASAAPSAADAACFVAVLATAFLAAPLDAAAFLAGVLVPDSTASFTGPSRGTASTPAPPAGDRDRRVDTAVACSPASACSATAFLAAVLEAAAFLAGRACRPSAGAFPGEGCPAEGSPVEGSSAAVFFAVGEFRAVPFSPGGFRSAGPSADGFPAAALLTAGFPPPDSSAAGAFFTVAFLAARFPGSPPAGFPPPDSSAADGSFAVAFLAIGFRPGARAAGGCSPAAFWARVLRAATCWTGTSSAGVSTGAAFLDALPAVDFLA
ncbi:hypothetical protein ACLGI4_21990 [Streptomyces sp. HMX112]|uniref:hypothetical protein n=1 Tax=Streptomyces sp. HMX112 TaxID=3390850 RepID=UPI003A80B23C